MPSWTDRVQALLHRERRVILGVTGPPGAGKSTVTEAIIAEVGAAAHVPMDGFHLADIELVRLGCLDRKGAIDTFDGYGYLALLQRIRNQADEIVYAPAFHREIEQPIAGSIPITPDTGLIVTEGNYLLDDDEPWPAIRALLNEVWFVDTPPDERRRRLVARHVAFGKSPAQAEAWVRNVDDHNAARIESARANADFVVSL
jgi:pantothenate kinase